MDGKDAFSQGVAYLMEMGTGKTITSRCVMDYDAKNKAALAYAAFAKEVMGDGNSDKAEATA